MVEFEASRACPMLDGVGDQLRSHQQNILCQLSGHHRPYTAAELKSMYGTHRNYVAQVFASARSAENDGYLLPFDAAQTRRAAIQSDVAQ